MSEQPLSLRFEHPTKKRYYHVILAMDLFGEWVVTKAWGGINKATGRITHAAFNSYDEARKMVDRITKQRNSRGYLPVTYDNLAQFVLP